MRIDVLTIFPELFDPFLALAQQPGMLINCLPVTGQFSLLLGELRVGCVG